MHLPVAPLQTVHCTTTASCHIIKKTLRSRECTSSPMRLAGHCRLHGGGFCRLPLPILRPYSRTSLHRRPSCCRASLKEYFDSIDASLKDTMVFQDAGFSFAWPLFLSTMAGLSTSIGGALAVSVETPIIMLLWGLKHWHLNRAQQLDRWWTAHPCMPSTTHAPLLSPPQPARA